jgi:hypothetical protein
MRPSPFMRARSQSPAWLDSSVTLTTVTPGVGVDPATGAPLSTSSSQSYAARVRQATAVQSRGQVRDFGVRDLRVWLPDHARVHTGQRCLVAYAPGDRTLEGRQGTVTDVDRDPASACRRATVRLDSDA